MTKFKTLAALPAVAALALTGFVSMSAPASAQGVLTNGPDGMQPNTLRSNNKAVRRYQGNRPLTVVRAPHPVETVVAAPAPVVGGLVAGPVGAASTVVGLPFQILGNVFPAGGPRKGGVTNVMYAGAGPVQNKIDEGFAQPVPVDRSGPVYVVENGDPTLSPIGLIGAPLSAAGTIVQVPFRVLGGTVAPGAY